MVASSTSMKMLISFLFLCCLSTCFSSPVSISGLFVCFWFLMWFYTVFRSNQLLIFDLCVQMVSSHLNLQSDGIFFRLRNVFCYLC
ncbi:hypothetical protein Hanom_Chr14g01335821 [Helianthus anomalus]